MYWLIYLPILFVIGLFGCIIYPRIVYDRFWIQQPIFHKFYLPYYFHSPQIIQYELPAKNKFTNFNDIETCSFDKLEDPLWNKFLSMIHNKTDNISKKCDLLPFFNSALERSYISFYNEPIVYQNIEKGYYLDEKKPVGIITSRPLRLFIKQSTINTELAIYYIDHLHVDNNKSKYEQKNISYELIQTHIYNQQILNIHKLKTQKTKYAHQSNEGDWHRLSDKNIKICLLKRNNNKTNIGVVPLCLYKSYIFSYKQYYFKNYINQSLIHGHNHFKHYQIFEVTKSNFHSVLDFIKEQHVERFDVFILPNINNLFDQILSGNLIVRYLFDVINGQIISVYFFRIHKKTILCVGSICYYDKRDKINAQSHDLFIYGFKSILCKFAKKKALSNRDPANSKSKKKHNGNEGDGSNEEDYCYFHIENIADNYIFVNDLIKSNKNKSYLFYTTSDMMYFFYNYIHQKCESKNVFVLV
jgi:hypothetical protein